ncbi:MAG: alpha/beta fold hydrolase [Maricaulaceae bacterium]
MEYPAPERRDYELSDGTISAWHFGQSRNPLKVVFLHANGFNGLSYRRVLEPLGVHAVALDLRGHGFSDLPTKPSRLKSWNVFRDDICDFFERYVKSPVIVSGHSYGAVSGILAAKNLGDKMSGYVGFDPVLMPRLARLYSVMPMGRASMKKRLPIARNAGKRRREFDSQQAAFEKYKGRGAFKGVPDEILNDYLSGGLEPGLDGGVQLSCDPLWEQAIFCAQGHKSFKALRHLPRHRRLIFAGKASPTPKPCRDRAAKILGTESVDYAENGEHLFPLHNPEMATEALREMINHVSLS